MATIERHWKDIGFYCVVEAQEDYWADFKVYKAWVITEPGKADSLEFERVGATSHPDPVDTVAEAQVFLSGSIKWDHCSNWHFDEQELVALHFCDKEQAEAIGVLFGRLYDLAAEIIPHWDAD